MDIRFGGEECTMMKCRAIIAAMIPGALALAPQIALAQQFTRPAPITAVTAPVILDTTGLYLERAARVGEDVFVTGQPTERALRELKAQGVTTVVNLRTPEEMTKNVPLRPKSRGRLAPIVAKFGSGLFDSSCHATGKIL